MGRRRVVNGLEVDVVCRWAKRYYRSLQRPGARKSVKKMILRRERREGQQEALKQHHQAIRDELLYRDSDPDYTF